jgi:hypothetical protein
MGGARVALRFAGDVSGGIPRATIALFHTFKFRHLVTLSPYTFTVP